jgi:hypothetical protein
VDSQCADDALGALEGDARPNVVLYFAHRAAKLCAGGDAQSRLVAAFESGLEAGMGVVVFHHGLYGDLYTPGAKDSLLQLIGAESSGISWNTTVGQRVFIVGSNHFVSTNGLAPEGEGELAAVGGVSAGTYPYFDNVPDERYPTTTLLVEAGEERVPLFATDSGGSRLLGYALTRPGWSGRVVAYQPGEYQPNALDARSGNNFQVLANALYFAAFGSPEPNPPDTDSAGRTTATDSSPPSASSGTDQPAPSQDSSVVPDSQTQATTSAPDEPAPVAPAPTDVSPTPGAPPVDTSSGATSAPSSPTSAPSTTGAAAGDTSLTGDTETGNKGTGCGCELGRHDHAVRRQSSWFSILVVAGFVWKSCRRRSPRLPSRREQALKS